MNYQEYLSLIDGILTAQHPDAPYDTADYYDYTKLNYSRMKRWNKTLELTNELKEALKNVPAQHWIIILEPWCGDAAHIVPFLMRCAEETPAITYELQLRDSEPFLIDQYLTNGGKGIPKMVARDAQANDLFVWGPRPAAAQAIMDRLKTENADFDTVKVELQNWYNDNKGVEIMKELTAVLRSLNA